MSEYGKRIEKGIIELIGANVVNVRSTPDISKAPIGKVRNGDIVSYYEFHSGGWWKIEFSGGEAFVSSEFVFIRSMEPKEPPEFPDTLDSAKNLLYIVKDLEVSSQEVYRAATELRAWIEYWLSRN